MSSEELTFEASVDSATSVAAAAMAAAESYAADEVDAQTQAMMEAWKIMLKGQSRRYVKWAMKEAMERREAEIAEPIGPVFPLYPYWNLLLAGPFQPLGGPGGPFLPHKIMRAGDPAFMLGALWRNPACINWVCPAPSACELMSGWNAQVWLRTCNLTTCTRGPSFGPFNIVFTPFPNCTNIFEIPITFPTPPQGEPDLYEANATVDITGPGVVSFAGYSTWVFDPDSDPFPPLPGVGPQLQYDIPARFLVYTP
jgi:hypothetical protein